MPRHLGTQVLFKLSQVLLLDHSLGIKHCLYSLQQTLPSVVRALKSKGAQLALCHELSLRAKQHRSVLEHDQFDLVVRLLNSALQVGGLFIIYKKEDGVL